MDWLKHAVAAAAALAASALAGRALLQWRLARREVRAVKVACKCGKVVFRVSLDKAEVGGVMNAICHCDSCMRFVTKVVSLPPRSNPLDDTFLDPIGGGAWLFQAFKDRVTLESGGEHIRCAEMMPSSFILRFYTSCCASPMGLVPNLATYPQYLFTVKCVSDYEAMIGPSRFRLYTPSTFDTASDPGTRCTPGPGPGYRFLSVVIARVLGGIFLKRHLGAPKDFESILEQFRQNDAMLAKWYSSSEDGSAAAGKNVVA